MKFLLMILFVAVAYANNPEENIGVDNPNLFEGDMILTDAQRMAAEMGLDIDNPTARAGGSSAMAAIRAGMKMWTDNTCITFKQRSNEYAYAHFYKGGGCSSNVGRTGRRQQISLAGGCWHAGIVAHEIGHALGFYHEQSRPDRDSYVTINWNNIISNMKFNFNKYTRSTIDSLGTSYDYGSVMHYGSRAFSKNRRPTITPKTPGVTLGNRSYLSRTDIHQMNLMYRCSSVVPPPPPGDCKDTGKYCYYHVPRGDCKTDPIVRQKCRKGCKLC
ncbi:hypothetical protein QZH41_012311 [Actinostola sp. cb2023]|nr:hypothetical protein QZH41_012311 [Actinostola sp. cb2023]